VHDQVTFTGSIPEFYDRYPGQVLFEPYTVELAGRVPARSGLRVLELACGTGIVTRRLISALPASARLVATDLSESMLAHAMARVPAAGIEWRVADAQALPFADATFDVVVCQFGIMFLPDRVAGLREARRVLNDGGLLLVSALGGLDDNPFAAALWAAFAAPFPDDGAGFVGIPYGYHDPDRQRADLAAAGFVDARLDTVRLSLVASSAADLATGFVWGTYLQVALTQRGVDLAAAASACRKRIVAVCGDRPVRSPMLATVISAVR
jgi:SAM-dependent methyltransferase